MTDPCTFFTFDFTQNIKDQVCKGSIPISDAGKESRSFNGMALWMEWILDEAANPVTKISNGPICDPQIGELIQWERNCKQGVHFFDAPNSITKSIIFNSKFSADNGNITFQFQLD